MTQNNDQSLLKAAHDTSVPAQWQQGAQTAASQQHATQDDMFAVDPALLRRVSPVTLRFADVSCERQYQARQQLLHTANDPWIHNLHLVIAMLHLCATAIRLEGLQFTWLSAYILMPYSMVALGHWFAAQTLFYQRHRTACVLVFEALYAVICTDGLPIWVLVDAVDLKSHLRDIVLGSGVLLSFWLTFFSNKPFIADLVAIPLHLVAVAATLTRPVCLRLEQTPPGRALNSRIASTLNAVAMPQLPASSDGPHTCANILLLWQVVWCGAILCVRYTMERRRRAAFVAPAMLTDGGPGNMHTSVGAIQVQLAVLLHSYAVVWVLLQTLRG